MTTFLCALPQEARHLRKLPSMQSGQASLFVTGVGPGNAERATRELLAQSKPSLVVSTGVAGALSSDLHLAAVIVVSEVVDEATGQRIGCHPLSSILHPRCSLLSVGRMITSAHEKAALAARFSAVAVDMESAAIARVCAEGGVPFAAIRAVSDAADETLPSAVTRFFDSDGRLRFRAILAAIGRQPSLIRPLRRLQRQTDAACRALADFLVRNPILL